MQVGYPQFAPMPQANFQGNVVAPWGYTPAMGPFPQPNFTYAPMPVPAMPPPTPRPFYPTPNEATFKVSKTLPIQPEKLSQSVVVLPIVDSKHSSVPEGVYSLGFVKVLSGLAGAITTLIVYPGFPPIVAAGEVLLELGEANVIQKIAEGKAGWAKPIFKFIDHWRTGKDRDPATLPAEEKKKNVGPITMAVSPCLPLMMACFNFLRVRQSNKNAPMLAWARDIKELRWIFNAQRHNQFPMLKATLERLKKTNTIQQLLHSNELQLVLRYRKQLESIERKKPWMFFPIALVVGVCGGYIEWNSAKILSKIGKLFHHQEPQNPNA
jgi:hypothetical protein